MIHPIDEGIATVFPAYAGMFLPEGAIVDLRAGFPRIRGDVPFVTAVKNAITRFSPHTRGCSATVAGLTRLRWVFPAYAGMFRAMPMLSVIPRRFPRIRGDVPGPLSYPRGVKRFSPHTRGCSDDELFLAGNVEVFPAYAGMFRTFAGADSRDSSFPRIRGDVP